MRNLRIVEENRILDLTGISHHAAIADDHVLADISIMPNLTVSTDNGRPFDHRAFFHYGPFADQDPIFTWDADADVGGDFRQYFPRKFALGKYFRVLRLLEIK